MEVLEVQAWLKAQSSPQYKFLKDGSVVRLKDGVIFKQGDEIMHLNTQELFSSTGLVFTRIHTFERSQYKHVIVPGGIITINEIELA